MLEQPGFAVIRMEKVLDARAALEEKEAEQRKSQERLASKVGNQ